MVLNKRGSNWGSMYTLFQALVNRVFDKAGLAVGTTTTRVKTTNAIDFAIAGRLYTKAATDPVDDFDGSFTDLSTGQSCRIRLEIDSAGAVTGVQGNRVTGDVVLTEMPKRSEGKATLGWIEIDEIVFTFGTTSYGAAGVAYFDGDPDLGDGSIPPHDRGITKDVYHGK